MILLAEKLLILKGETEPIVSFEVWFRTGTGLHATLDDAISRCVQMDLDPNYSLVPVIVAVTATGRYEEVPSVR